MFRVPAEPGILTSSGVKSLPPAGTLRARQSLSIEVGASVHPIPLLRLERPLNVAADTACAVRTGVTLTCTPDNRNRDTFCGWSGSRTSGTKTCDAAGRVLFISTSAAAPTFTYAAGARGRYTAGSSTQLGAGMGKFRGAYRGMQCLSPRHGEHGEGGGRAEIPVP